VDVEGHEKHSKKKERPEMLIEIHKRQVEQDIRQILRTHNYQSKEVGERGQETFIYARPGQERSGQKGEKSSR